MMCSWKTNDVILGAVILVFTLWQTSFSKWIVVIAAAILIIHAFLRHPHKEDMQMGLAPSRRRKRL